MNKRLYRCSWKSNSFSSASNYLLLW